MMLVLIENYLLQRTHNIKSLLRARQPLKILSTGHMRPAGL